MDDLAKALGLDRATCLLAVRLAAAAWLAFAVAAALHVDNAYWAAMPVWVVTQPTRGLVIERGIFRILGTLIGAAFGFALLHTIAEPLLVLAAMAVWIAASVALTRLWRGVKAYGALLAGMTAAIVVVSTLLTPDRAYHLAVARVECTLIGVAAVTVIVGLFTPRAARDESYERLRRLAADAVGFAAAAVQGGSHADPATLQQVMSGLGEVEASARVVAAGSVDGIRRLKIVDALIAASIAVMAAAVAVGQRRARGQPIPAGLPDDLARLQTQLRSGAGDTGAPLPVAANDQPVDPLARLTASSRALVAAERALFSESGRVETLSYRPFGLVTDREWQPAVKSGIVAGAAAYLACALGLITGLPYAVPAALGVCIFSSVLGTMPNPAAVVPKMVPGIIAGVLVAILYRLAVQPHLAGWLSLVVTIVPFLVAGGLMRAAPPTALAGIDANMCFLLVSQAGAGTAALPEILGGAGALAVAAVLVGAGFYLIPIGRGDAAAAVAARLRSDLTRLLGAARTDDPRWRSRMGRQILRLGLDVRRHDAMASVSRGSLAALNLGHAIAALREAAATRVPEPRQAATDALALLAGFADTPTDTAAALERQAATVADPRLSALVGDAAGALRDCAELLSAPGAG